MKKKKIIYLSVAAVAVVILAFFIFSPSDKEVEQKVKVKKGDFEIVVTTSGELVAPNSVNITGPIELQGRNMRGLNDIKILDMVAEGTVVDSGDYVASLDPSTIQTRLKDLDAEVEKYVGQLERTQLDTSLNLRTIRNNIKNLEYEVEEKQIVVDQSIYEPPATQRQAKNALDKALRDLDQEKRNYTLKVDQAVAQVAEVQVSLNRARTEYDGMVDVLSRFNVRAPRSGMVIYYKGFSGEKRKAGSSISAWDIVLATLPDFTVMDSKTYINEIDISKIKTGQDVRIGIDAFPDKSYTGQVISVANIGEQLKNADAKVFEVVIRLRGTDPILRPAMTTSNQIVTASYKDVVYIPTEAIFGNDTMTYVYKTNGIKQVVVAGDMNENYRIIEQGLENGEELYLSIPQNAERFKLVGEEFIPLIKQRKEEKEREEQQRLEEAQQREEARKNARQNFRGSGRGSVMPQGGNMGLPPQGQAGGTGQHPAGGSTPSQDMSTSPNQTQGKPEGRISQRPAGSRDSTQQQVKRPQADTSQPAKK